MVFKIVLDQLSTFWQTLMNLVVQNYLLVIQYYHAECQREHICVRSIMEGVRGPPMFTLLLSIYCNITYHKAFLMLVSLQVKELIPFATRFCADPVKARGCSTNTIVIKSICSESSSFCSTTRSNTADTQYSMIPYTNYTNATVSCAVLSNQMQILTTLIPDTTSTLHGHS